MDAAYLKQTVGTAISEALAELVQHGHSQTHPKLSINLGTNPYSTSEDPVSFVARYLLNYSETAEKCKKDDQQRQKIVSAIANIHRRKRDEELAIIKAEEDKKAQELLALQLEQERLDAAKKLEEAPKDPQPDVVSKDETSHTAQDQEPVSEVNQQEKLQEP